MRPAGEAVLDFLIGEWSSADRVYPGRFGPGGTGQGTASYGWAVGGKWLAYDFRTQLPGVGPYEVHGGVLFDPKTDGYRAFAVNSLGNLLLYEGGWDGDDRLVFTLIFPARQEDTRVTYIRQADGFVRMTSERPAEGGGRELYFETVLSPRISEAQSRGPD